MCRSSGRRSLKQNLLWNLWRLHTMIKKVILIHSVSTVCSVRNLVLCEIQGQFCLHLDTRETYSVTVTASNGFLTRTTESWVRTRSQREGYFYDDNCRVFISWVFWFKLLIPFLVDYHYWQEANFWALWNKWSNNKIHLYFESRNNEIV
jgi:hypothetical protein